MANQSEHVYVNETPVIQLDAATAFKALSKKEQIYAHHLSKASWVGSLIVLFQTSPESPLIFALFRRLLAKQSLDELKQVALKKAQMSEEEWRALLVYLAAFYSNMGNYRGYGNSKFIPGVPQEKLDALVKNSAAYEADKKWFGDLWKQVGPAMYSLEAGQLSLGFAPKGMTTYWSKNMTEDDAKTVKSFLVANNIDAYNTRALKDPATGEYIIRFASVLETDATEDRDYLDKVEKSQKKEKKSASDAKFRLERGDHSPILKLLNKHLQAAKKAALNSTQVSMLDQYIKHFNSGNLDAHKEGSRFWIKDKSPAVETYIGFIENYRDPAGQRAEFEGFVGLVNKEMTKKFAKLVDGAASLLPKLPWSREFEKDRFLRPDFTSLDVLTFSGSTIPAGINIPNYDEIRQNEGFKNVSLGNVITALLAIPPGTKQNFLRPDDGAILEKYSVASFEVQVGLHELLGHGCGKLLKAEEGGGMNFDKAKTIDPLTGEPVKMWYAANETYDSKFGSTSSAYEECRAESVGLYLSLDADVLKIFGHTDPTEQKNVIYANWLSMVHKGLESLKMYSPSAKKWLQAHSQARYVILRVLLESTKCTDCGKHRLVRIDQMHSKEDGKLDLLITLTKDHSLIQTKLKKAIGDFLLKLQTYKSLGDAEAGITMFERYSAVNNKLEYPYLKFRDILLARQKPRRLFLEAATALEKKKNVQLRQFECTHEGLIGSFQEHFGGEEDLEKMLVELWKKDEKYFV